MSPQDGCSLGEELGYVLLLNWQRYSQTSCHHHQRPEEDKLQQKGETARASVKMTQTSPLPGQSSQIHVAQRYQDSISLQPPQPGDEKLSCGVGTGWGLILLCLDKAGWWALNVLLVHSLSRILATGAVLEQSFPVGSINTIQVELLYCPAIFFGDLGVTARSWSMEDLVTITWHQHFPNG